jgi:hypothetical protein
MGASRAWWILMIELHMELTDTDTQGRAYFDPAGGEECSAHVYTLVLEPREWESLGQVHNVIVRVSPDD